MSTVILASTGILTEVPDQTDHRAIVDHGSKLGAGGLELQVHDAWYAHLDEVIEDLKASELSFPAVHADKAIGVGLGRGDNEADEALATLEVNCRAAAALDARVVVVHLWEEPESDQAIERNLERLPACLDTAEAYNLVLGVETIQGMVGTALANIQLALERDPRCRVTLDTEFLGFHGQLEKSIEADWLWADRRVSHVHVKDFDGRLLDAGRRRYLLPGEGSLDLQRFLTGLVQRGYGGAITVEGNAVGSDGKLDEQRLGQVAAVVKQLADS